MNKPVFLIITFWVFIFSQSGIGEAAFSGGTYHWYERGNSDYFSSPSGGDGTYVSEISISFDGSGNFSAQMLADSEGDSGTFNGTYTVAAGVLTLSSEGETLDFRISPDGETLVNLAAVENPDPEDDDNEIFRLLVKDSSVSSLSGDYHWYELGNSDYFSSSGDGDGTYVSEMSINFDGAGDFSAQMLTDSEGDSGTFNGTYTVAAGVLTLSSEGETLDFHISPDGETLVNLAAVQNPDPEDDDNEIFRLLVKDSSVSSLSGDYHWYELGNSDYFSSSSDGDGTYVSEMSINFDGSGNFSAQMLADSEGDSGTFNGTYTVAAGVLTLSSEGETLDFRISPDGETLVNLTAVENPSPEDDDNEIFRLLVKILIDSDEVKSFPWMMLLLD